MPIRRKIRRRLPRLCLTCGHPESDHVWAEVPDTDALGCDDFCCLAPGCECADHVTVRSIHAL